MLRLLLWLIVVLGLGAGILVRLFAAAVVFAELACLNLTEKRTYYSPS